MADARIVANRFLELAREQGRSLTPMQVLKLVYIAHGWMLGLNDRPLINQPVEAWQYGPVVRDVYNSVRQFGRDYVTSDLLAPPGQLEPLEDNMVQQVFDLYGKMDGIQLSNITHMPNTPWAQMYRHGSFGIRIPDPMIAEHYKRLSRERSGAAA
ncbi:MAG: SocA family protein [Novosphingobium sp.]|nr:SocA family protein [Novosphingobium sp.]